MNNAPHSDIFPDLPQCLLRCLLYLSSRLRTARAETAIPAAQLHVLGILYRNRSATATEMAAELGIKKQSLTLLLTTLHELGYTERERDDVDARKVYFTLAPAGRAIFLRELHGRRERLAALITDRLTEDEAASLQAVLPIMEKLAGNGEHAACDNLEQLS